MVHECIAHKIMGTKGTPTRSGSVKTHNEAMRLTLASFAGVVFGFFLGVSSPTLSLTKMNLPSSIFPSIDLTYVEDYSKIPTKPIWDAWASFRGDRSMSHELPKLNETKVWFFPLA
ncbi:uncharacterized protein LOC130720583 [Lotus japonicus]|uniref:uncharacterized protein LOC130720583 n=1 Tax=Lotus japonicus TaxID=34305 RepID=UPI00258B29C1|nr:uncharacterized protein LOC130720583 [Lotus japonicus]